MVLDPIKINGPSLKKLNTKFVAFSSSSEVYIWEMFGCKSVNINIKGNHQYFISMLEYQFYVWQGSTARQLSHYSNRAINF